MNDLYDLLRSGDPVESEGLPGASRLDEILRRVHDGRAGARLRTRAAWSFAASVAVTAGVCVVGAIFLWVRAERRAVPALSSANRSVPAPGTASGPERPSSQGDVPVRHLQFSTPEGVRVYWTFDPGFHEH